MAALAILPEVHHDFGVSWSTVPFFVARNTGVQTPARDPEVASFEGCRVGQTKETEFCTIVRSGKRADVLGRDAADVDDASVSRFLHDPERRCPSAPTSIACHLYSRNSRETFGLSIRGRHGAVRVALLFMRNTPKKNPF